MKLLNNSHKSSVLLYYFSISLLTVCCWILIVDIFQLFLVELLILVNGITYLLKLTLLLLVTLATSLVFWSLRHRKKGNFNKIFFFVIICFTFLHIILTFTIEKLEHTPRVKSISKNWSIQGDKIVIRGKNFGEPWSKGKVYVDDLEFTIVSWNNFRILVEQPVSEYSVNGILIVCNHAGNCSRGKSFAIRDPSTVL